MIRNEQNHFERAGFAMSGTLAPQIPLMAFSQLGLGLEATVSLTDDIYMLLHWTRFGGMGG